MDTLKAEALKQGRWRLGEDGYIEKGPFPKEKTSVNVSLVGAHSETGESILSLTPRHAGESPVVYYSTKPDFSGSEPQVETLENFHTAEGTLYFLVKDPTGKYEVGTPARWLADLKIRHQVSPAGDKRTVTLQCTPSAEMHYTLDGPEAVRLLVHAKAGEATKNADFQIPASGDKRVQIDDTKPARLGSGKRVALDTTDRVFGVINRFRDQAGTRFKGVRIEIGEGENTVTVRFQEREITAAMIEGTVNSLRDVLQETQAPVAITVSDGIQFESGFEAKEFAKIAGMELRPGDVAQEE
jgi:hypothetical protein